MGLLDPTLLGSLNKLKGLLGETPIGKYVRGQDQGVSVNGLKQALLGMPVFDQRAGQQDMVYAMDAIGPQVMGLAGKIVYHGSPHKFDRFDASKIWTGEGAQAYGHGVYLADAEDVAKGYQKTLAYKAFDLGPEAEKRGIKLTAGARGEFHRQAAANRDPMRAAVGLQNANISARELPKEKLAELFDAFQKDGTGALYKADLPDEWIPKMLDWDKPLKDQPEVLKALESHPTMGKGSMGWRGAPEGLRERAMSSPTRTGEWLYREIANNAPKETADALQQAGIPGIRYLDGGSRPNSGRITMLEQTIANLKGKGASQAAIANAQRELDAELARASYNYVVFPGLEDQVKILERNGVPLNGLLGGK